MEKKNNSWEILLNLIKFPLITEKTLLLSKKSKYTFIVDKILTKNELKRSLELALSVRIKSVKTSILPLKTKKVGKFRGKISAYKKAIIQLSEGCSISELFN